MSESEAAAYVGDDGCIQCHEGICRTHMQSHHADTFRVVSASREGPMFRSGQVVTDQKRSIRYSTAEVDGREYMVGDDGKHSGRLPADYVIGSASNGYTFFSALGPDRFMELRTSYYPHLKRWDFTPNQAPSDNISAPAGIVFPARSMALCLSCHVTVLRGDETALDLQSSRLGIGCERCHGPGRAHVEAVRAASRQLTGADLKMENLRAAPPQRIEALCGTCHKETASTPQGNRHIEENLPRFPAAALERSACFVKSGKLSCVTCHDPHANLNTSVGHYDRVCLSCHSPAGQAASASISAVAGTFRRTICKVNPASGCTGCHMPRQSIPILSVRSTNHWIKVWKKS